MTINPILKTDYPDPDIIRVNETYYMISTTMYYMPGGVILRSYDLINWEIASYIFDSLDNTPNERLEGNNNSYGKGMWAASLRYNNGKFYVAFVSHGMDKTHIYISDNINGPWEHKLINLYMHDCSLLFDNDRVYSIYGNTDIHLVELNDDLTDIKENGINKVIIKDNKDAVNLGYEGSHFYKINDKYIITLIHWPKKSGRRTESVFICDTIDGNYTGYDVTDDDLGFHNMGIAQGGLVDTVNGDWYSILFRDNGAVGRIPVLVPVSIKDNKIVFGDNGKIPSNPKTISTNPDYQYTPLFTSDDFNYDSLNPSLKPQWQWNHVPQNNLWYIKDKTLNIKTGKLSPNPILAQNTLTQRAIYPGCQATVTIDATKLNNGDTAGLIALQGQFCMIGLLKEDDTLYLVQLERKETPHSFEIGSKDIMPAEIAFKEEYNDTKLTVKMIFDFEDMKDTADCFIKQDNEWRKIGDTHKLKFGLDFFTGTRFGLCIYSQKNTGGEAGFSDFKLTTNI